MNVFGRLGYLSVVKIFVNTLPVCCVPHLTRLLLCLLHRFNLLALILRGQVLGVVAQSRTVLGIFVGISGALVFRKVGVLYNLIKGVVLLLGFQCLDRELFIN